MRIYLQKPVDRGVIAKDLGRLGLGDPIDHSIRKRSPSFGERRQGVNNVADGSELNEKYPHVMTMLPKIYPMSEPLFCSVPEQI